MVRLSPGTVGKKITVQSPHKSGHTLRTCARSHGYSLMPHPSIAFILIKETSKESVFWALTNSDPVFWKLEHAYACSVLASFVCDRFPVLTTQFQRGKQDLVGGCALGLWVSGRFSRWFSQTRYLVLWYRLISSNYSLSLSLWESQREHGLSGSHIFLPC